MTEDMQEAPQVETTEAVEAEDQTPAPQAQEAPEPAPKPWADEDEAEARLFGWKSPAEWQGEKPPGYIDQPQEFLDRVKRSRIFQTMEEKMAEQARKLAAMNDKALERQQKEYEARLAGISAAQRRAVEEADTEAYDRLEQQRQGLIKEQQAVSQPVPQPDPQAAEAVKRYAEKNDWVNDPVMRHEGAYAVDIALRSGQRFASPDEQIAYAESVMRRRYPHLFQAPAKPAPRQVVDGGGLATAGAPKSSAFDKLPADGKAAFERFVKQGVYADTKADREEYAREYNAA